MKTSQLIKEHIMIYWLHYTAVTDWISDRWKTETHVENITLCVQTFIQSFIIIKSLNQPSSMWAMLSTIQWFLASSCHWYIIPDAFFFKLYTFEEANIFIDFVILQSLIYSKYKNQHLCTLVISLESWVKTKPSSTVSTETVRVHFFIWIIFKFTHIKIFTVSLVISSQVITYTLFNVKLQFERQIAFYRTAAFGWKPWNKRKRNFTYSQALIVNCFVQIVIYHLITYLRRNHFGSCLSQM